MGGTEAFSRVREAGQAGRNFDVHYCENGHLFLSGDSRAHWLDGNNRHAVRAVPDSSRARRSAATPSAGQSCERSNAAGDGRRDF